jgi:capsule polysaccharide modification protein KpsS
MYFGIAKFIQEKHNADFFAIVDVTNKPKKFYQQQKIVNFTKTWFFHDHMITDKKADLTYLKSIEKKYDINLWLLACNERIFYNFNEFYKFSVDEIMCILEQECKLFENILDEAKPDFLVMPVPNFHHDQLFYLMCKKRGVKVLLLTPSRFGNRSMISENPDSIDMAYSPNTNLPEKSLEELEKYIHHYDISEEGIELRERFASSYFRFLKAALNFLFKKNDNLKTHYTYYGRTKLKVLLHSLKYSPIERSRELFLGKKCVYKIDNKIPFIFFPMSTDPEATLLITTPFYTNQLEMITQITKSLPVGYQLYVKDHPLQQTRSWREISYYKKILELPNVKLIHPTVSSDEIIKKSSLIISAASTAGIEAAFYNKPSIVFSDVLYDSLSSVYKIKNISELPATIRKALNTKVDVSELNKLVDFIHNNSFEFNWSKFSMDISEQFFFGGHLVDVEIPESKMKSFLQSHETYFKILADEHMKKINQNT